MSTTTSPEAAGSGTGVRSAGRAKISAGTLRLDRWWMQPVVTGAVLFAFVVYSTWRAFANADYYAEPLLSPFYSPCLSTGCVPGSADFGTPFGSWFALSPALIILIFPLGFRLSCYYYRKAYYRSFWLSPPACAVAEPHMKYSGESRFPLVVQNIHRYFFYAALVFNVVLTFDAVLAFQDEQGRWFHLSVGTLVLLANAALLWVYSLSCHSCRHAVGGRLKHFSKHPVRYRFWTVVSRMNTRHMLFAWMSLFGVALADFYVYLVASGTIENLYFF